MSLRQMCTRKTESIKGKATTMNGFYGSNRMNNSPNAHNKMLFEENIPRDWRTIATNIARSVQDLQRAIINTENANEFRTETYAVVDAVRYMLYSSRSLDKDAIHLQDQEVKESLRLVLSTLAKLILSAKAVNDINTDNMDNNKVKRDAADVLTATRKFVTICQTKNVQIQQIEPILKVNDSEFVAAIAPHGNNNGAIANKRDSGTIINANSIRAKHPLNQDLVVSLQTHAKQIVGSTDALCKATTFLCHSKEEQQGQFHDGNSILSTHPSSGGQSLILEQKSRSNFILLFQNLTSQIGNYFTILEDIDISNVDVSQLHSLPDYYCNKQRLYNAVGLLFSAIQTLTDTKKDLATAVASVEHNIANVENTIEMIFSTVVQMVAERKVWLMRTEDGGMSTNSVYNKDGTDTCDNSTITPNNTSFNEVTSIASSPHNGPHYLSIRSPSKEAPLPQQVSINNSAQQNESLQKQTSIKLPRSINSSNKRTIINRQLSNNNVMTNGASDNAQATARSQFWFLGYDYDENDIEFTQDKNIKGGTLEVLVERLTLHDYIDMSFIANFLLTYRSFCTTEEFVALLQERYNLAPPESLTPDELEIWTDKKQKLVRLRVFNVMKNWLENYYNDEDEFILDKLQFFANTVICDSSSFSAEQLNRLIRKRRELEENTGGLKKLIPNALYGPMPIMPKNLQHIHLLDTDPLEMARQLTILDFKLYSSIQPIECLGKAWCKDGSTAVNVKQSIDYCNRLTAWVTGTILSNKEAKKRVVLLKYWAQVANRCLQMNNFNTCMAVLSAFDNSAVARLKKTWELVSGRTNQGLAHIRKIMGSNKNFQEYREMIHSVNPPCIPFLGIYLQDLTFIEDGNPDMLKKSNNLINFAKRQKAAEVIREIKQFQSPPYNFQYVPEIQVYIKMQLETSKDIDFLYERSLELEPRNNNPMTVSDHAA
ncbi:ras guanine nucleotide exchange factor domain-containing protein [Mycotypha africana]|uniref:ras guanine nucleotide exchange factor domain-containing protein n=1 Tax=Mycotypha africana TaxID=64632 RepID=UPI002301106C|nr:ras guanine nucleotide exchange factor domain-containing protein [Mycotypha africana]KAI8969264.1 ras guanine nucleotide exchange factor domain-containing protein [Mycotypha africana]